MTVLGKNPELLKGDLDGFGASGKKTQATRLADPALRSPTEQRGKAKTLAQPKSPEHFVSSSLTVSPLEVPQNGGI